MYPMTRSFPQTPPMSQLEDPYKSADGLSLVRISGMGGPWLVLNDVTHHVLLASPDSHVAEQFYYELLRYGDARAQAASENMERQALEQEDQA